MHVSETVRILRQIVVLGDSIAAGMCASAPDTAWAAVATDLLEQRQQQPITLINRAIPSNVVSPRCPAYHQSAKPSLLERYHDDCIALRPDTVIIAEGLNDMRAGMPVDAYIADMHTIMRGIQQALSAQIVLVGMYPQTYGRGANDPTHSPDWTHWGASDLVVYHTHLRELARQTHSIFVDTANLHRIADQVLAPDACHLNDTGHRLLGHHLAQTIASFALPI